MHVILTLHTRLMIQLQLHGCGSHSLTIVLATGRLLCFYGAGVCCLHDNTNLSVKKSTIWQKGVSFSREREKACVFMYKKY